MALVLPLDAVAFVVDAFADANETVARRLCRLATAWEESLDMALIERLREHGGPVGMSSGWTVRIETHFLGGGRHFDGWEVADIGILVAIREEGHLRLSKASLFQSKRLYPIEVSIDEAEAHHYHLGLFRLWESDLQAIEASRPRAFTFADTSEYKMLLAGDRQVVTIERFEKARGALVHYLLYNPAEMGWTQHYPLTAEPTEPMANNVGCRVVDAAAMRTYLDQIGIGMSATFDGLRQGLPSPYRGGATKGGRRLEAFIERLLTCKEGYVMQRDGEDLAANVFSRRQGPISAAIAVTFDAPG